MPKPTIAVNEGANLRLIGTKGRTAAVGKALEIKDGYVCWKLDPTYGAWFWPLMHKLTELVLSVPEAVLEPAEEADCVTPPRAPSEAEKDKVLKMPEQTKDAVRIYRLVIKGKTASVNKAFPTRTVSLGILRYCRKRVVDHP